MLETQYGLKEHKKPTKTKNKTKKEISTVGIFSNLDGTKPVFDIDN